MDSAGERLKKIRLEKGISLEQIQKKTKVNLKILQALEGDSLTDLSPVYLKGFLKIYCNFLGLDPKDYIEDYKATQSVIKDVETSEYLLKRPEKPASFFKTASVKLRSFRPNRKIRAVFIFIGIIIIVTILLFNLGKFISSKRAVSLASKGSAVSIKQKPKAVAQNLPKPQKVLAEPKKETPPAIRLVIRARRNCWVYLKADGKVLFQRVLEKGRFESWQAKEKIELSLGDAGAVEIEVNGQLFSNLGRKGQARKNIVITKEGLNTGR